MRLLRSVLFVLGVAGLLTLLFWGPLWCGYGLVGGDLYPYFFPQKAFLADRLHAGEFPLWNNLTGFGYPVLGESQTGAAYPPYLLAYYFLDANTAYNVEHLLHYVLCFAGTWLFCRRIGLDISGASLAAIVFTYGWFPPRACLEWAIVTGAWLPIALWCVEAFVQTRWWRYAIGLSLVLGLQLLAGHFHLAFITQLLVVAYGLWRIRGVTLLNSESSPPSSSAASPLRRALPLIITLGMAVGAGFFVAAIQLVPAWELKARSSRATVGGEHEPSYGHLPPLYLSQMIAPWIWYSPAEIRGEETERTVAELAAPWHWFGPHRDLDEALMQSRAGGLTSIATNKVEAHLYCGLIPLGLAVWWLVWGSRCAAVATVMQRRASSVMAHSSAPATDRAVMLASPSNHSSRAALPSSRAEAWFWLIVGGVAAIYATGWLLPVARYIPGFNFFRGPGRYGIVTTLAVAILAGRGLGKLIAGRSAIGRSAILVCIVWSTVGDLWLVSRMVKYAVMVSRPAITLRNQSPIRKLLLEQPEAPRLYAPMQNLGNLLGVSCLPVYLGIAPAEYADQKFAGAGMPKPDGSQRLLPADRDFSRWLNEVGVTHILSEHPLDESAWGADQVWQGIDPMLNTAMGRSEPLYLYRLRASTGRASIVSADLERGSMRVPVARPTEANRFSVQVDSPGDATLLIRELDYPGWQVELDGQLISATDTTAQSPFRAVQIPRGEHRVTWSYRPFSVKLGLAITLVTLFALAAIGHVRFWRR